MRLSKRTLKLIETTLHRALTNVVNIEAPVSSFGRARRIFDALTDMMAEHGGRADRDTLRWNFPNGSTIRIVVNGTNA